MTRALRTGRRNTPGATPARAAFVVAAALAAVSSSRSATAEPSPAPVPAGEGPNGTPPSADFDPTVEAWNSLHYLPITAREAKVNLEPLDELDWAAVTPDDVLVIIAPDRGGLAPDLAAFVEDGGGVLLAVDVGTAPELVAALGIRVDPIAPENDRYFRDHPGFPSLTAPPVMTPGAGTAQVGWPFERPQDTRFLWYNVSELVLNHPVGLLPITPAPPDTVVLPSVQYSSGQPSSTHADGATFVAEVRIGRGQALVVGDASLFIDDMQRNAYGDKQFAANAMRWFCGAGPCDAKLVTPKTRVVGTYVQRHGQRLFGLEGILTKGLEAVNDSVSEVNSGAETDTAQLAVGLGLVLVLLIACLRLPWPEVARRFTWQLSPSPTPPFERYWASALAVARPGADFSVAAIGLESRLRRALTSFDGSLAAHLPTSPAEIGQLAASVRAVAGTPAADAVSRSLTGLVRVNMGAPNDTDPDSPPFTLEELEALWTDTTLVEQALPPRRTS